VSAATVSLHRERAIVDYDPRVLQVADMTRAIRRTVVLPGVRLAIQRAIRPSKSKQTR
jgi:hypothetical protein